MDTISGVMILAKNKKLMIAVIAILTAIIAVAFFKIKTGGSNTAQYQTAQAEKGSLIKTVNASGLITSGNSVEITTQSSGVIKNVYVKNGDSVTQGEVIADLSLDQTSQQRQAAAYAGMLSAEDSLNAAKAQLNTLQNTEFTANQKFINDAAARGLSTTDPTYIEENAAWLAAEASYKDQQTVISQAQAAVNSAGLSLQQSSTTITAPIDGVVSALIITPGTQITSTSGSGVTPQSIGSINQPGPIEAQVNISEIDAVSVSVGQKVTMTLDAFPNDSFSGRVLGINTNGVVSSGVTNYPATISFDSAPGHIYPNMAVTASIITKIDSDVLLVPSSAIQTQNGQDAVRELKNNQLVFVPVQVGDSNDTQTGITSGVSEGDTVVTAVVNRNSSPAGATTSPFGIGGGRGGFGGGGGAVIRRGG